MAPAILRESLDRRIVCPLKFSWLREGRPEPCPTGPILDRHQCLTYSAGSNSRAAELMQ